MAHLIPMSDADAPQKSNADTTAEVPPLTKLWVKDYLTSPEVQDARNNAVRVLIAEALEAFSAKLRLILSAVVAVIALVFAGGLYGVLNSAALESTKARAERATASIEKLNVTAEGLVTGLQTGGIVPLADGGRGRVFAGSTLPGQGWVDKPVGNNQSSGVSIPVDTSQAKFKRTPKYFVSIVSPTGAQNAWDLRGENAIYGASPSGFTLHLNWAFSPNNPGGFSAALARENGLYVMWFAVGE